MKHFLLFGFLFLSRCISAQMPDTDIWLFDLQQKGDSFKLSNGTNITNRPGYDNQPSFSPDNKFIYYTSYRNGQSDIYQYNIKDKTTNQFTATPESEYSPSVTPDGKFISVVRVEKDSAQRLWKFPLYGGAPELVYKNIDSVGYYCWLNNSELYLFLLGNPEKIVHSNANQDTKKKLSPVMNKGGRSMKTNLLVNKADTLHSFISISVDRPVQKDQVFVPIIETLPGKEDFAVCKGYSYIRKDTPLDNPDAHFVQEYILLMGNGSTLFSYSFNNANKYVPVGADHWKLVIDLSGSGIKNIGRIAISPDGKKIAIVSTN